MSVLFTEFMSASSTLSVFIKRGFVVVYRCGGHKIKNLLLSPVGVELIEVPEFSHKVD